MTALIPKEMVTRYLGRNTPKYISYPAAAAAGFFLAVCSCTVIPLFAGIYKKGAGLGPAITFLFVAPAVNILALTYTGALIGMDLAIARLILSIIFGIGVGVIMASIFREEDVKHDEATDDLFAGQATMRNATGLLMLTLVALLIVGTFQIDLLKETYFQVDLPFQKVNQFQENLFTLVPFDPAKGEEGVTAQGALLIGLLILIGLSAWKGLDKIYEGFNRFTWISVGLVGLTLLIAALGIKPYPEGVVIQVTGKSFGVFLSIVLIGWIITKKLTDVETQDFFWETWRFVKQIFPLLIIGVFVVGIIRELIQPEWIQAVAGKNSVIGNFIGVVFGVFMYFPTLVEVPVAQMFLDLGMHRGPLLAYLIADPELSLQSILITASIIGRFKAWFYVAWVSLFCTIAGLLYGAWIDDVSIWSLSFYLLLFLTLLVGMFWQFERRNIRFAAVKH